MIDQAEGHGYFRGQIEFLLEFCGAAKKWRDAGRIDWGTGEHALQQEQFESYLKKAEMMFNTRGLVKLGKCRWERALLSIGDYIPSHAELFTFCLYHNSLERLAKDGSLAPLELAKVSKSSSHGFEWQN